MNAKPMTRGFTLVELMIVVAIISMLAAVAIPSFMRYIRRSQTTEVVMNIRKMFDSAAAYYYSDHASTTGSIIARQFPASAPTWAPPIFSCCGQPGGKCAPNVSNFTNVTWTALNFSIDVPFYYQYWFASSGVDLGANFLTYGVGDLDCDYTSLGIYYRVGAISPDRTIQGSGLVITNELE